MHLATGKPSEGKGEVLEKEIKKRIQETKQKQEHTGVLSGLDAELAFGWRYFGFVHTGEDKGQRQLLFLPSLPSCCLYSSLLPGSVSRSDDKDRSCSNVGSPLPPWGKDLTDLSLTTKAETHDLAHGAILTCCPFVLLLSLFSKENCDWVLSSATRMTPNRIGRLLGVALAFDM